MLKVTKTPSIHPKTTDIAIPSLESITAKIQKKIPVLTESQTNELAKAVHTKCKELKKNPPARIITRHRTEFDIKRAPSKRTMYWSMGYPSDYTISPISGEGLPAEMHFKVMTIPVANRILLHYVDKDLSEYCKIDLKV